jgi:outer membrane protein OmpU
MNKFTKVGVSALAGSLASFAAAQAVEMSAAGSAKLTYKQNDGSEVTGNPMGMNTSISFSGSGEVNGYATTLMVTNADKNTGMSSASLSVDLGDLGKITFDQGVGAGGISTIDDKTPSANEEVWDGLDAVANTANGLVGGGNSGVFVYSNTLSDMNLSIQMSKGGSSANTDDAASGAAVSGASWDFALTNNTLVEGLDMGVGYGVIANANQLAPHGSDDTNEHAVAYVNYSMGMVTAGVTVSNIDDGANGGQNETGEGFGIAINVNDSLSVSYGEREVEYSNASAAHVTEDMEGMAVAYTMGSAKITLQQNETSNNGGTVSSTDEMTEVALSLSF